MPRGLDDAVRGYQLPSSAPGQPYLSQYNLASNAPIYITPGFGGSSSSQLPPIQTGSGHYDVTITYYMDQSAVEQSQQSGGGFRAGGRGLTRAGLDGGDNFREGHVKRVFQLESDNSGNTTINPDVWVDVLRIDKLPVIFGSRDDGVKGQIIDYKLNWNDDPNNLSDNIDSSASDIQGENGNVSSRSTEQINIKNPDDPNDRGQSVYLWIVDRLRVARDGNEGGEGGLGIQYVFNNVPSSGNGNGGTPNERRTTSVLRVVNNDLNDMQMSDSDGSNPALVGWGDYQQAMWDGTVDDSQHLDVEMTDNFWVSFGADEGTGVVGQIIQFDLTGTRDAENMFYQGDPGAVDANGDPSLVRTDPLQAIVNIGLGGLAVIFGPQDLDAPAPGGKGR